jgi:hypothetical protein
MSDERKLYLLVGGLFLLVALVFCANYIGFFLAALFLYWPFALYLICAQDNRRQRITWATILFLAGIIVAAVSYYFLWLIFHPPLHDQLVPFGLGRSKPRPYVTAFYSRSK